MNGGPDMTEFRTLQERERRDRARRPPDREPRGSCRDLRPARRDAGPGGARGGESAEGHRRPDRARA